MKESCDYRDDLVHATEEHVEVAKRIAKFIEEEMRKSASLLDSTCTDEKRPICHGCTAAMMEKVTLLMIQRVGKHSHRALMDQARHAHSFGNMLENMAMGARLGHDDATLFQELHRTDAIVGNSTPSPLSWLFDLD